MIGLLRTTWPLGRTGAYLPNDQKTGKAEGFLRKKSILNTPRPEGARHVSPGQRPGFRWRCVLQPWRGVTECWSSTVCDALSGL